MEWRFADGNYERLPALAADLVKLNVDVIVTDGTPGALAAQKATRTIPIVFAAAGDLLGNGLVKSLARPGSNTTGLSLLLSDTGAKQMEMLMTMLPRLSRLAVVWNPANPNSLPHLKILQAAGAVSKMEIIPVEARTLQELESAFLFMSEERAGAFIWIVDSFLIQEQRQIAQMAVKRRLASIGGLREYAEAGGLMSYGQNRVDNYRRVATYVDKIFKGANPGDLPVEQPTKLELVINRKTAKALGLTIPPELLLLADRVIE
jgi:putative ABC transport system substrate-binding protein